MEIRNILLVNSLIILHAFCLLIVPDGPARLDLFSHEHNATLTNFNLQWIDGRLPVKILVHGYRQNLSFPNYEAVVTNYLKRGGVNVITVDFTNIAYLTYAECFFKIPNVEMYVAQFIKFINTWYGIPLKLIHIIGHSLGGQMVGRMGNAFTQISRGKKVHRITSLDPTKMGFESILTKESEKITKNSATIVDVLHTDTQTIGVLSPMGTVDFYANRGFSSQPGCVHGPLMRLIDNIPLSDGWIIPLTSDHTCSHEISLVFFAQSIRREGNLVARQCLSSSWDLLNGTCQDRSGINKELIVWGEDMPENVTGIFYFFTNADPPYVTINT